MCLLAAALFLLQNENPERLIEMLRSDSIEEREKAAQELKKMGKQAIQQVERAAQDKNTDVAVRAQEILVFLRTQISLEEFHKVERMFLKDSAVKVRFKGSCASSRDDVLETFQVSGLFIIKSNNRAYIRSTIAWNGQTQEVFIISDGQKTFISKRGEGEIDESPTDSRLSEDLRKELLQVGPTYLSICILASTWPEKGWCFTAPSDIARLSEIKPGMNDGDTKSLTYSTNSKKNASRLTGTLWYEPATCTPVKRELVDDVKAGAHALQLSESFEAFSSDPDIPDATFTCPELGDKAAEAIFREILGTLERAESFSVKCKVIGSSLRQRMSFSLGGAGGYVSEPLNGDGSVLVKRFKVHKAFSTRYNDGPAQSEIQISDGRILFSRNHDAERYRVMVPENKRDSVGLCLLRSGLWSLGNTYFNTEDEAGHLSAPIISHLKMGATRGAAGSIGYVVTYPSIPLRAFVSLMYDQKTLRILERQSIARPPQSVWSGAQNVFLTTETYEDLHLNPQIPDEKFIVPERKK